MPGYFVGELGHGTLVCEPVYRFCLPNREHRRIPCSSDRAKGKTTIMFRKSIALALAVTVATAGLTTGGAHASDDNFSKFLASSVLLLGIASVLADDDQSPSQDSGRIDKIGTSLNVRFNVNDHGRWRHPSRHAHRQPWQPGPRSFICNDIWFSSMHRHRMGTGCHYNGRKHDVRQWRQASQACRQWGWIEGHHLPYLNLRCMRAHGFRVH